MTWVAAIFLRAIFWWWFEFRLSAIETWSFSLYFFVLAYAFLIYLACALLFPRDLADYEGFKDYFYSRRAWFFGVNAASIAVDVVDTLSKGVDHFRSLGPSYPILMATLGILFLIAMRIRSERFHAAFAVASLLYLLVYPIATFRTVQQRRPISDLPINADLTATSNFLNCVLGTLDRLVALR